MELFSIKFNKLNKSFTTGFTLVEVLVAISIFTVSLIGMMSVLAGSIANTSYAKQKMIATYLAQEGIEYVRNMRDNAVLYTGGGNWTSFRNTPNIDYPALGDFTGFDREVWLDKTGLDSNEVKVFSKVEWAQGSGAKSVTFTENLFDWYEN
mgnify:CR=1 FL=1